MEFQPSVLHPEPDTFFVSELRKIDPTLRVVWGYDRYLLSRWAIERRIPPDRYRQMYRSALDGGERFIPQPIFDEAQPIFNEDGELTSYRQVGTRQFDLAPELEHVMFVENEDGSYRGLDSRTLLTIRRTYAWERFHSITRHKFEKQAEREAAEKKAKERRTDAAFQEMMEHKREIWNLPFSGQPSNVMAGTNVHSGKKA